MPTAFSGMSLGFALLALVFATGLPLFCAFVAVANVRRYRVKAEPCDSYQVPPDVRRKMAPWINRLGHFGFRQVQLARLDSAGFAEAHRWILLNEEEKTYATLERTVPVSGVGASVALTLFTPLRDGTLVVTADHRITHHPPAWWQDVQAYFGTVAAQWKQHYSRIRGDKDRIVPPLDRFTGMLAADEEARHEAQVKGGEFVPTRQDPDVLRLRFSRLPSRVLPLLGDFLTGRCFRSARRRDVAAPAKARTDEGERIGGPVGLSLNQAVEQDLSRYRALIAVRSSPLDHLRRIVVLLGTVAFFIALFGRDQPLQTALVVLALSALHEAGHWAAMRIFRYRALPPVFFPFVGCTERARKLHAPAWQQLVVLLAGPLPGLIAGLAMLAHGYFSPSTPGWMLDAAGMAVALNALHLLPVLPMDGGRIIDLLVFRDLPLLRPFFTVTASLSAFAAALVLKSRVLRYIAAAMFGGVLWDVKTIQVVRGARKLPWAGEVNDENEALRRIFRGLREDGQGAFIGSDGWHKKIEALLIEVMRKRPAVLTRFAGGGLLAVSGAVPALLMLGVLLGPVLGDAGRIVRNAEHVTEFRTRFPKESRTLGTEDKIELVQLARDTEAGAEGSGSISLNRPRQAAEELVEFLGPRLDRLDWTKANIASRSNEIGAPVLPVWVEIQCLQMERSALAGDSIAALRRAEEMLGVLAAAEPATSVERREQLTAVELRVLAVFEREAASGRMTAADLDRIEAKIRARIVAPDPEVEGLLLVAAWAERSRMAALSDAAAQATLDPRFWRDLYPRIRIIRRLLSDQNSTSVPASVALARHWRSSRRVGDLPPHLGPKVGVSPGEAELVLGFCESHRLLAWRRVTTVMALGLERYRQKHGKFPETYGPHSVASGADLQLVRDPGPKLRLTDRRYLLTETRVPAWLTPPTLPLPPTFPPLDYDCPLLGTPVPPELSAH
jgi:Zn-dependent protease